MLEQYLDWIKMSPSSVVPTLSLPCSQFISTLFNYYI
jgi:hypothetical protein